MDLAKRMKALLAGRDEDEFDAERLHGARGELLRSFDQRLGTLQALVHEGAEHDGVGIDLGHIRSLLRSIEKDVQRLAKLEGP